jgi:hypothetical protein
MLSFSWEIATNKIKEWVNKKSVPKGETQRRTDASSTIPLDSLLGTV